MAKPYIASELKRKVIERAQGRCEYCQCRADYTTETFPIEHVVPRSRGGTTDYDNLALSCSSCNGHKYNKIEALDPITNEVVSLFTPRHHRWEEHFGWQDGYTHIIGLTPVGRATVETLKLNHPGSVNLREALYIIGKHPPKPKDIK